ncbi:MAG: aspartate/glutamate racemase family protein [Actinomycetota bacterium]
MSAFDIGILAGSGPEAGMDLWQAVLDERRHRLGAAFRGDLDAPSVLVRSDPRLGLSMDLARHGEVVAAVTAEHAAPLDRECHAWAIACNTINRFAGLVRTAGRGTALVSYPEAVDRWLHAHPDDTFVVLGARPVASLGDDSAYAHLRERAVPLSADDIDGLHQLIEDVKRLGPVPELRLRFDRVCRSIEVDHLLLACTELPLLRGADRRLVDVTRLVAGALLDAIEPSVPPIG